MDKPEWREYEEFIFEKFSEDFPDCSLSFDQKVTGYFSRINRQVDVLIQGTLGGHPILGAIECKCFNKKISIKEVDAFVGFLEDINANIGIMITKRGYSQSARNRTFGTKIKLEIVSWEEFPDYDFSWDYCICEPDNDSNLNLTDWWVVPLKGQKKIQKHVDVGLCKCCHSVNVKCKICQDILYFPPTGITNFEECSCKMKVKVEERHSKKGIFNPKITLENPKGSVSTKAYLR